MDVNPVVVCRDGAERVHVCMSVGILHPCGGHTQDTVDSGIHCCGSRRAAQTLASHPTGASRCMSKQKLGVQCFCWVGPKSLISQSIPLHHTGYTIHHTPPYSLIYALESEGVCVCKVCVQAQVCVCVCVCVRACTTTLTSVPCVLSQRQQSLLYARNVSFFQAAAAQSGYSVC